MAKYYVECSCGHTEMHELFGKGKDREYRIGRIEGEPCAECRAKAALANTTFPVYTVRYFDFKNSAMPVEHIDGTYDAKTKTIQITVKMETETKRISYAEYKNAECLLAVADSYDAETKTIEIIIEKIEIPATVAETVETVETVETAIETVETVATTEPNTTAVETYFGTTAAHIDDPDTRALRNAAFAKTAHSIANNPKIPQTPPADMAAFYHWILQHTDFTYWYKSYYLDGTREWNAEIRKNYQTHIATK